ncbi:MAG: complex I NDUFA9 subunit family protein [Alphaproteobacteria bacterium]|nr:complex I NDUFA9 subunit family protein [Alphaproteobacteria bacterium]
MHQDIITVVGGTGFLGRYVVAQLAKAGFTLRVIVRNTNSPAAQALKTSGDIGQIVLVSGNLARPESLKGKLEGSLAVVNLVGILAEGGSQKFARLHAQGAEKLAKMAKAAHVSRFIQVSALGVDKAHGSRYANSKMLGEQAVMAAFPDATILRPSVIFGAEDNFLNQFARMAAFSPALPLIGGGETKFQPVYAGDVARAIVACIINNATAGRLFELGGSETFTFRQLVEYVLEKIGKKRCLISIPFSIAGIMGAVMQHLPAPLLTRDQVQLLKYDNVVESGALKLTDLGITPTKLDAIASHYLARFNTHKEVAA